ncbi:HrpA-like helicase [Encephalitozoon romaleae SJ-2008]|uniref:RNA helicase n=1 Tax=Encephalitozoon romaleae (strain SJ-2008) TaxID=1178016 RepID=I6ZVU5_ENCRO|nr:HrpA-like helicase [Encephalitozoon romaleae SJ-2008]AFN83871.1 HrpA-like helicase [Encephalitozoon romaleae SJ-2008]
MTARKEKLLKKYLEKKRKQRSRDELYAQIAALNKLKGNGCDEKKPVQRNLKEAKEVQHDMEDISTSASEDLPFDLKNAKSQAIPNEITSTTCEATEDLDGEEVMGMYLWDSHIKNTHVQSTDASVSPGDKEMSYSKDISESSVSKEENTCTEENARKDTLREYDTKTLGNRREDIEEFRKTLPIYYEKGEIICAVRASPIVFVTGATGCGKTTQIPQFLYEGGLGMEGMIGVTQPRRISATSISARINEEANENLCGYKIRYESTVTSETKIKIMTDGVLLKEIQEDFLLSKYSVIIIDEIHERSTNIDLLISIIPRIMKVRKERGCELRLVLMSATGDVEELKGFLGDIKVFVCPEKRFQVSTFYEEKTEEDYLSAAYERIRKIVLSGSGTRKKRKMNEGKTDVIGSGVSNDTSASILVFLTSKQEIYQLKNRLEDSGMDITVLPLHSSLSKVDQEAVFIKTVNRKVVLATNIAETSITIADIVFVIDSGKVKNKTVDSEGVTRYSVDFITKSNAIQRMGRAGRTGPGICYRLYSGEAYEKFYESPAPQILREPLDNVVLNLMSLGIRNAQAFPFLSKPRKTSIDDAITRLQGLGAVDENLNLTDIGKKMSRYPIEPRLARLLCTQGLEDIFTEILALISLISSGTEIKKNRSNKKYFEGSKSDLLVQLGIYNDFLRSKNRKAFCTEMGLNYTTAVETMKMMGHLLKLSGRAADKDPSLDLSPNICLKIRNIVYRSFADHLVIPLSGSHFFHKEELIPSRDSISVNSDDFVVFETLVSSKGKLYMKNVTIVEKAWF